VVRGAAAATDLSDVTAGAPDWTALSRRALLHHVSRGDPAQALLLLRRQLIGASREAWIAWRGGDDAPAWIEGAAPPAQPPWTSPPVRVGGRWWLPLDHLDERVGVLVIAARPDEAASAFEPLVEAAAVLAAQARRAGPQIARAQAETLRAALRGAGTFVWQWDPLTDELADIDEGFSMLGYAPGHFAPTQQSWNRLIHPDDLEANDAAYQRHASGEIDQYEHLYRALAADGRWRWLHERGRIVERAADGTPRRMLGTQTDVTEQRELEAQAAGARVRLELIARNVPGVLYQFVMSADGERGWFPFVSERCEAVFGVSAEALTADAANLMRLVEPDWRERMIGSIEASRAACLPWRFEFPIRRTDGQRRWLLGSSSPRREADGSTAWFGYMADVTELRELEAASRDKAAAEATSRAKSELLSRMSHELRTPLNAVLGFAQLLEMARDPALADPHRRHVRLIREAGEHLLTMIGELLDLTRIESGQMALRPEPVALAPLVEECFALLQAQAAAAQVRHASLIGGGSRVLADRTRLKQVLLNLLSNALKYNRAGGRITVGARADGAMVVVEVADSGVGIAPEHLARLFEPFQRGAHQSGPIEGTGIGLAVSKSLVELMGGSIGVQSTPGQGSTFAVRLPAA
jgi:PAS domain S-box-containing protein